MYKNIDIEKPASTLPAFHPSRYTLSLSDRK